MVDSFSLKYDFFLEKLKDPDRRNSCFFCVSITKSLNRNSLEIYHSIVDSNTDRGIHSL